MLKAASREKEGWLSYESIEKFKSTDLRTIDQLWVKYSNGRFGFSVQKRIWESVGKNYEKFGDRVGWTKGSWMNKDWIRSDEVTFDTSAKEGHLPRKVWIFRSTPKLSRILGSSLASRLVKCNL